jgi:7-cyano-7-deazaguanine synthase
MCSIAGGIFLNDNARSILAPAILASTERGRDSWGLHAMDAKGAASCLKRPGTPSKREVYDILSDARTVVCNLRAEPTTEWVEKAPENIQPFTIGDWTVAHNGTIANDKELKRYYSLYTGTTVDSSIIAALLDHWTKDIGLNPSAAVQMTLKDLRGSFSVAITHRAFPDILWLACNYKPLYLLEDPQDGWTLFGSQSKYFDEFTKPGMRYKLTRVAPYSLVTITPSGITFNKEALAPEKNHKALVVCSGGLDSTVAAAKAIRDGYDVMLLHFVYGCLAGEKELDAVQAISDRLGVNYKAVDLRGIFHQVKSPLLDKQRKISPGEAGAEFAYEWVPARNLIMLSVATGIAESIGASTIMLGNNLEESGAYPDNEMEFVNLLNDVLPYAVAANKKVDIQMPVGNLMKHEIVKLGETIGAPLDLTWSCYSDGDKHCGSCGPCYMRKVAYQMNGLTDPMEYSS